MNISEDVTASQNTKKTKYELKGIRKREENMRELNKNKRDFFGYC